MKQNSRIKLSLKENDVYLKTEQAPTLLCLFFFTNNRKGCSYFVFI